MKRNWERLDLRSAYKPVPEAIEQTVHQTLQSIESGMPAQRKNNTGRTYLGMPRRLALILIAGILLIGMAAACAVSRPALLEWLLGIDGATNQPYPAGASLSSTAQLIEGEKKADHITIRMNSLVYDGERFSFSYEAGNDAPGFPALIALDPCMLVNGEPVFVDESKVDGVEPCLAPSPRLDVLPVQRNPVLRGGWSRIIPAELSGEAVCEMTFIVCRPRKAFVFVPDPDDVIFHREDCPPEQRAEVQDVIDTWASFQNAVLAGQDALDPAKWFRDGYSVISDCIDPQEWIDPGEEGFDHLIETARIIIAFRFDAGLCQAYDFSGLPDAALADCAVHVNRFQLSPLSTDVYIDLIPLENTKEAAQALARKYGPMDLTDETGNPVAYAQMDSIYENMPWPAQQDGQWRCRYMIQMPGLQEWPQSVGITVAAGELLRVDLTEQ